MQRHAENTSLSDEPAKERQLHAALAGWAGDHARRYPGIDVLPYDPDRFPDQRIGIAVTRNRLALEGSKGRLEGSLRAEFEQTLSVSALQVGTAVAPCLDELRERLGRGESVVVLTAHADLIHDIGVFAGGLALALADPALIARNGTILNKVMSREAYGGVPIPSLFRSFANLYWVIPETATAARWGITSDLADYVNASAMRTLLGDMRRGLLLTIAPSGTAMRAATGEDGRVTSMQIPTVSASTANLIGHFDAYAIAVRFGSEIAVGPLTPVARTAATSRAARRAEQQRAVVTIMEQMAAVVSSLAAVPVSYEDAIE